MRFHLASLPHTQTTHAYDHCAYTAKVRKWADMMFKQGHEVYLYAGEENEAQCTEHICCITKAEQDELLGHNEWYQSNAIYAVDWDPNLPLWQHFNNNIIKEIRARIEPRDFVCLITGYSMSSVVDAFPAHQRVEFGVGYEGIHPNTHHVFESYAWMHCLYGKQGPSSSDGRFYDTVIPNYYDISEFPGPGEPDDYFLFISRMIARKGYDIAIQATKETGTPLKIAGVGGDTPQHDHVEYVGLADASLRGQLMRDARATFVPTIYLEPFGGVAAESLLCGTPVITTDWGAFPEYVRQGVDGFRCHSMQEFIDAIDRVDSLDRLAIRDYAQQRFSANVIGEQYERYFERLTTLWGDGFYTRRTDGT